MSSIYSPEELTGMGIRFGSHVSVHRSVLFFGRNIVLGSHVRIDCHCVITGSNPVEIGNFVHLGLAVHLGGTGGISIGDYVGLSSRCSIFTSSDDYSGGHLANPTIPDRFKQVRQAPVRLERHALVGTGSVLMPGVVLGRGCSVGAMSFVNKSVPDFAIVSGCPPRRIGTRDRELLEKLERQHANEI